MAQDGELDDPSDDDASGSDREDIRTMIREELGSVLDEFRSKDNEPPSPATPEEPDSTTLTVRDIEAAAERAVRTAMKELAAKAPTTKATKPAPAKVEAPPESPPTNWLDKVKKAAWS